LWKKCCRIMPTFSYRAKRKNGKTVTGRESARSRESLVISLERKNLTVISISKKASDEKSLFKKLTSKEPIFAKVKTFDLMILCRQLSVMLHGGVPILNAIESIMYEAKSPVLKKILESVASDLREGKTLSGSFKKHPGVFSTLFIAIMEAGEKVGSLDEMLRRLAVYLESRDRLARKIRSATTYPAVITVFFLAAIAVLTLVLIPKFKSIYESFGAELPALTQIMFDISSFVIKNIVFIVIGFGIAMWGFISYVTKSKRARRIFDNFLLHLPIFGDAIRKAAISKFCRTLSTLLGEGISVTEAMRLVGRTSGNSIIEEASDKAVNRIVEGEGISQALAATGAFPHLMLQMASVGVDSGSLPELLDKTADFYEEQVDTFVSTLTSVIEPILIVILGVLVGVVVMAMYLPIFNLTTAATGG